MADDRGTEELLKQLEEEIKIPRRGIIHWLAERFDYRAFVIKDLDKPVPGDWWGWFFTLGTATAGVFLVQAITGILMAMYYAATPEAAYDSVKFISEEMKVWGFPIGHLIRGMHFWGSTAMIILVGLHMLRVLFFGSYKKPREVTWLIGVLLLIFTAGFAFTGYLLPWDQKAYWATQVGTNILGTLPVIGQPLKVIIRGGQEMSAMTLTRFYAIHVLILPALTTLLIIAHLALVRMQGISGTWRGKDPVKTGEGEA